MKRSIKIGMIVIASLILLPLAVNFYVVSQGGDYIVDTVGAEDILNEKEFSPELDMAVDCILVLGAGLKPDGSPNFMLQDRLDAAIELYNRRAGTALHTKLLLTGDNGQKEYDEVNAMKDYVQSRGVASEDIFLDHAGFSTYESMYRAAEIFKVESAIVITQTYHQYRALYLARGFGIRAVGVSADQASYKGQSMREIREVLARDKDFVKLLFKPQPTYLGDAVPISGSGLTSHD